MTAVKELHEVMVTEAQLAEGLAVVLGQQQEAIVSGRVDVLDQLVEESEELIQPITILEHERVRLSGQIISERTGNGPGAKATSRDLLGYLDGDDVVLMKGVLMRLRTASHEIIRINNLNRPLLEHSQAFVTQTLRAATDDYKRNLIDKKM